MTYSKRDTTELSAKSFDVAIVGGGITGAWLALHCVQQGWRTALIERGDYASETSSSSSKLLHGGIRYLQQFEFGKVRESAMERAEYVYAAPHLSAAVPFIIPTYRDFKRSKLFLNCGMLAYQLLCLGENKLIEAADQNLPRHRSLSANELNDFCDLGHEQHTGGVLFYERHMLDSERMVLAIIQTARKLGAVCYNHVRADAFLDDEGHVTGIKATDLHQGTQLHVNSKLVINAAGPFIDNLNTTLKNANGAPSISGFAVGSHVITRKISEHAIALTTKHQSNAKLDRGGRHVFVIPWRDHSLIGTSYDEIDSPNGDLSLQSQHVEQLLDAVNEGLPSAKLDRTDVISGYSGLYPLNTDNIKSTVYQGSGEYQLIDHEQANGVQGLVTALGAKFTTGRKISELTVKWVGSKFGTTTRVAPTKLASSQFKNFSVFNQEHKEKLADLVSDKVVDHLAMLFGSELDDFISRFKDEPEMLAPISATQPDLRGQIVWAIEREQALKLDDVLYGRTSLALLGISADEVRRVADIMANHLNWDASKKQTELESSLSRMAKTQAAIESHDARR